MATIYGSNTRSGPPALKHFFRCTERAGESMEDSVAGVVWTPASKGDGIAGLRFNQYGSVGTVCPVGIEEADAPIPIDSGEFHTFSGTNAWMCLYAARYFQDPSIAKNGARFSFGDINNKTGLYATPAGLGLSNGRFHVAAGNSHALAPGNGWRTEQGLQITLTGTPVDDIYDMRSPDGVLYKRSPDWVELTDPYGHLGMDNHLLWENWDLDGVLGTPVAKAFDVMVVVVYEPGGTKAMYCYDIELGCFYFYTDYTNYDDLGAAWQPNPAMRIQNLALYGAAVFEFSAGLPADWLAAAQWMARRWKLSVNERVCYPPWYDLT